MSKTAEELIDEDPSYADAIQTVLDKLETSDGVEWDDVEDDMSSGQWGRLIQEDIIEDTQSGYVLKDRDAAENAVSSAPASTEETGKWTLADKVAALAVLAMTSGYYVTAIRDTVGGVLDIVFGPINALLPFYAVLLIIGSVTAVYSTFLQSRLMDTEAVNEIQSRMKELQKKQRKARKEGNKEKLKELREEQQSSASDQFTLIKEQFRPTVWIALFTIPVFLWVFWVIQTGQLSGGESAIVMPLVGSVEWTATVGPLPLQTWIVWYILASLGIGQIIRKVFNVDIGLN